MMIFVVDSDPELTYMHEPLDLSNNFLDPKYQFLVILHDVN